MLSKPGSHVSWHKIYMTKCVEQVGWRHDRIDTFKQKYMI
jgi:hypothetical protein